MTRVQWKTQPLQKHRHTDEESQMENNNISQKQYEILPLYYHKFAQPYLSEDRLGYLCASDK
jgi:hypothetical protein